MARRRLESHIGDAAATEMGEMRGEINIGQLCRELFAQAAMLIGFGTDRGTVAAASDWDGPMELKQIRPAHRDSYEQLCRDSGLARFVVDLQEGLDRTARSLALSAARAGDRRYLPAGDGTRKPLFRSVAPAPVRRLSVVRGDARRDATADGRAPKHAGNLSLRAVRIGRDTAVAASTPS
jgi:Erythromycin esterase